MIVEDHLIVSEGLAALLNDQPDMTVVSTAGSVAESVNGAERTRPDVVLIDFRLPDGTGAEAGARVRRLRPNTKLIFLSRDDSDVARIAAMEAGASAFLHKSRAAAEVVEAIRIVARGGNLITPALIAELLNRRRAMTSQLQTLTSRERQVLRMVATGISSREIAKQLGISYTTVRTHIRSLGYKLDVHSKIEATVKARELGLID
ncbi:MAG TPA: response regulator transcription factor [Candidatus Dormibacteraeota bacterium]|nr:response regulator transcription factor [Candidatus Dormibacteraeota bacterium]